MGNGDNGSFDINIDIDKRNIVKAYTTISRDKFVCRECVRQKGKTRSRGNLVYKKKTEEIETYSDNKLEKKGFLFLRKTSLKMNLKGDGDRAAQRFCLSLLT